MKYKPVSELCIRECGRKRRKGQRDCAECHREAMKEYRRKKNGLLGSQMLDRAQLHLLNQITPKIKRRVHKNLMDARALLIGLRLKLFIEGN